jgi:hypothetical protein
MVSPQVSAEATTVKERLANPFLRAFASACLILAGCVLIAFFVLLASNERGTDKIITAQVVFGAIGLMFGIIQVLLGVLLAVHGVNSKSDGSANTGEAGFKLVAALPGLVLIVCGTFVLAFVL